ncbi:MAG TPA: ribonuclease P protein component [Vicinamibacteria bacterium]|nr:ribonuclease P protein component [Vicinamibacteria bacterium]
MRFRPQRRLRRGADFDAVFRRGRRLDGRLFLLLAAPNRLGHDRLGLAVSRRVGGAVARNRARRLLRESFRRLGPSHTPAVDLVLVARAEIVGCGQAEVDRELRQRILRIRPAAVGGAGPPAPR